MQGLKAQLQGFPIVSVDAKKTEKIGNMKNAGKEWTTPGEDTKGPSGNKLTRILSSDYPRWMITLFAEGP
jgi:hypothetical protein